MTVLEILNGEISPKIKECKRIVNELETIIIDYKTSKKSKKFDFRLHLRRHQKGERCICDLNADEIRILALIYGLYNWNHKRYRYRNYEWSDHLAIFRKVIAKSIIRRKFSLINNLNKKHEDWGNYIIAINKKGKPVVYWYLNKRIWYKKKRFDLEYGYPKRDRMVRVSGDGKFIKEHNKKNHLVLFSSTDKFLLKEMGL